MRLLLLVLAAVGSVANHARGQSNESVDESAVTIGAESLVHRVRRLLPPHVGCAVMVLGTDHEGTRVEFKHGYGEVRAAGPGDAGADPVTPTTNFRVASFTKVLTAAAVLKLVDQGEVALDDSIGKWLPLLEDRYAAVTIESMLDHTSGLPAYHGIPELAKATDCSDLTVLRAVARAPRGLPSKPKAVCDYSNTAYVLLGLIVQQASGRPFPDYLRDEILRPAGMDQSEIFVEGLNTIPERAFGSLPVSQGRAGRAVILNGQRVVANWERLPRAQQARLQAQLERAGAPLLEPAGAPGQLRWVTADQGKFTRLGGDGALYTSLDDLQALLGAIARRELPLSSEAYERWLNPTEKPPTTDRFGDAAKQRRFTLGWVVDERRGETRYSHRGGTRGFCQTVQWFPESDRAVVVLMNSVPDNSRGYAGWDDTLIERLGEEILRTVLDGADEVTIPNPGAASRFNEPRELRRPASADR